MCQDCVRFQRFLSRHAEMISRQSLQAIFIALRPAYRALIDALDTLQAVELDKVAMDADLAD